MDKDSLIFRALERGLWDPLPFPSYRYDRQYAADPARFLQALKQAWRDRDLVRYAMMAGAHWRGAGRLEPHQLARLCFSLFNAGRHEEAVQALEANRRGRKSDARYWSDLGAALAGSGRLAHAAKALKACLAIEPDSAAALELHGRVEQALVLENRLDLLAGWPEHRRLIDLLWGLGAVPQAAAVVQAWLRRGLQTPADQIGDLLEAVQLALTVLEPQAAFPLMDGLRKAWPEGPERRLAASALDCLAGEENPRSALKAENGCKTDAMLRLTVALAMLRAGRRGAAIERFGRIGERFRDMWQARLLLAHAVSQEMLAQNPSSYRPGGGRKVFDLITFNNEKELLQAKLAEEAPWVDVFVIVEANRTFTGALKPFHFDAWRSEFAQYKDKIVHVKVDHFPDWADTAWARDFYQRDMALAGASGLWGVDDLVMVTDTDEIVDRRAVEGFDGEYGAMLMETFRYFLNLHLLEPKQHTGVIMRAKYFQRFSPSFARFALRSSRYLPKLDRCGWHFTSIADAAGLAAKMQSYAHQEHAHMDEAYFERLFSKFRGDWKDDEHWERWALDERFPASIRERSAELEDFILPLPEWEAA